MKQDAINWYVQLENQWQNSNSKPIQDGKEINKTDKKVDPN